MTLLYILWHGNCVHMCQHVCVCVCVFVCVPTLPRATWILHWRDSADWRQQTCYSHVCIPIASVQHTMRAIHCISISVSLFLKQQYSTLNHNSHLNDSTALHRKSSDNHKFTGPWLPSPSPSPSSPIWPSPISPSPQRLDPAELMAHNRNHRNPAQTVRTNKKYGTGQ